MIIMQMPIKRIFWLSALGAVLLAWVGQSSAAVSVPPKEALATLHQTKADQTSTTPRAQLWNLRNADLLSVIDEISRETGKDFIVDPRVHGKITIVSSHPLHPEEVYQAFLSMLQVLGYAAIDNGDTTKIVPAMDVKQNGAPLAKLKAPLKGDAVVAQVFAIKHGSALQLVPVLRPLLPQWADVAAYRPANSLIVTGTAQAVQQVAEIIERVDGQAGSGVDVIKLQYAGASQLVSTLNFLDQANHRNGISEGTTLAADDSTNSVLVSGTAAERLQTEMLIKQLDKAPKDDVGNIEVVYLHYLQANKLVKVLGGQGGSTDNAADNSEDNLSQSKSNSPASNATEPLTVSLPETLSSSGNSPWGKEVVIRAEPATNALIIKAPPTIMRSIKNVIARLDVRPAQVLVQAIIVEMSNGTLKQLGIQWGTLGTAAIPSESASSGDKPLATAGTAFENITGGLGLGVMRFGSFKSLISALEQDNASDILSTPSLVVLDNQKAEIKVGKQLSIVNGSYAASHDNSGNINPYTTTSQEDVGLTLEVVPQINQGNAVRLSLAQKNATIDGARVINSNPVTNNTLIKTSVIVNDGDILVLGGLTTKEIEKTTQKIPFLGSIPVLGHLFSHTSTTLEKKNLMIFLKPTIVRNNVDASALSFQKYNMMRNAQWDRIKALNEEQGTNLPLLPALSGQNQLPDPFGK